MSTRSGSIIRSKILASRYTGSRSRRSSIDVATSRTAWWNSSSPGFFASTPAISRSTYALTVRASWKGLGLVRKRTGA